jgi:NADH-quinone oxidoreductase subunit L
MFHLTTHAFFKALLFLGAGSVIIALHHEQDIWNMGGLRKKMPVTFWTFVIGGLALSGFPLVTAGFWSKDEILSGAFNSGHLVVFITLALAALLTAFYTMRQITLTFLGKPRTQSAEHASENKWVMTLPLGVLSIFAIAAGWVGIPKSFPLLGQISSDWFAEFVGQMVSLTGEGGHGAAEGHSYIPLITSLVVALGGLYLGWLAYRGFKARAADPLQRPLGGLYRWMKDKYYFDELYQLVFIRPARWISETFSYHWIDRGLIDGFLHAVARFGWWLGERLRYWIDLPVVNGAGDTSADGVQGMGSWMKGMQSGRVQQYMVAAISVLVVLGVIILYIFRA